MSDGLWFLEFQQRGAPHFHLFLRLPIAAERVAAAWYRIVASGDEKHLRAGTRVEWLRNPHAAGAYAAKYACKPEQKTVPDGFESVGRFWGVWGRLPLWTELPLGWAEAVSLVRAVRTAYRKKREGWRCKRRWRDRGRWGFTAWDVAEVAQTWVAKMEVAA